MFSEDFINMLKSKYKVRRNKDGSYTVNTGDKVYTLREDSEYMFEDESIKNKIGNDDLLPNFDNKISKEPGFRGAIPTFEDIESMARESYSREAESMDDNPMARFDPILPGKKNKKRSNEPDPDNFNPRGPEDFP